jgi:cysteine desulfurase
MTKTAVYLDYNATAPLRPEAREVMLSVLDRPSNASSVHSYGRMARMTVEKAREQVAKLVSVDPTQVVFNSGATEGNNTVLKYFAGQRVLVSAIDHPSVLEAAPNAERIPVMQDGIVDLNALRDMLESGVPPSLVSVMLVNNETGVIQPIAEISALAKSKGAMVHCDAVQAVGRIPVDMMEIGASFLTLSAHKIGGAQGVGALIFGQCGGDVPVLLHGGGQEKRRRAGTENVAGIASFGAVAHCILPLLQGGRNEERGKQDRLESELKCLSPDIVIFGQKVPRIVNTTLFALPNVPSETMMMALDLDGIAMSNGSACSSGTVKASTVLKAMGVPDSLAASALRVSTGWATTDADIDRFLESWSKFYDRVKKK